MFNILYPLIDMLQFIKQQVDRSEEVYVKKCERNRKNIQDYWDKVKGNTTVYDRKHTYTNVDDGYLPSPNPNPSPRPKDKKEGFKKPNISEVKEYCKERKNSVDAEQWMAHYESNGWKVGRNPMKNWKMAIITWEKSSINSPKSDIKILEGDGCFEY